MADKSTVNNSMLNNSRADSSESDPLVTWRSFNLRVSNEPDNLKLHSQRVLFGLENDLSDYVAGALQDLFICLKQKGLPLRQRLFNLLSPKMLQSDRVYFQQWLADNSDENLKCYRYLGAVFQSDTCQPVEGLDDNYSPENNQFDSTPAFNDQYEEALYNLESGQLMKAKGILENICLKNPNALNATNELQVLYTLTRDKMGLESFTQRYIESNNTLTDTWSDLLKEADQW